MYIAKFLCLSPKQQKMVAIVSFPEGLEDTPFKSKFLRFLLTLLEKNHLGLWGKKLFIRESRKINDFYKNSKGFSNIVF